MKKYLIYILMLVSMIQIKAQSQIATLCSDGEIISFYGLNALQEAHNKANNGDIITLSSGNFLSTDITKAITLRGEGMNYDPSVNKEITLITGDFNINISDTINKLTIEGIVNNQQIYIHNKLKDATFLKCRFNRILRNDVNATEISNLNVVHCDVTLDFTSSYKSTINFLNSVINLNTSLSLHSKNTAYYNMINCIVLFNYTTYINNTHFRNCILIDKLNNSESSIKAGNSCYNCLYIGNHATPFFNMSGQNWNLLSNNNIFKPNTFYYIEENVKSNYIGTDGTEIGLYGGSLPFDANTTGPQIVKCNVASKTTIDGKLSIDIEIKSAD